MGGSTYNRSCYRCGEPLPETIDTCGACHSYQAGSIDFVSKDEVHQFAKPSRDEAPEDPANQDNHDDDNEIELEIHHNESLSLASEQSQEEQNTLSSELESQDKIQKFGAIICPRCEHETSLDDEHCDNCLYYINDLLEHDEHFKPPEQKTPFGGYRSSTAQSNMENLAIVTCFLILFLGIGFYLAPNSERAEYTELDSLELSPAKVPDKESKVKDYSTHTLSETFKAIAAANQQLRESSEAFRKKNDSFSWGEARSSRRMALDALREMGHISQYDYEVIIQRMNERATLEAEGLLDEEAAQPALLWQCERASNPVPHYTSNPTVSATQTCSPSDFSHAAFNRYRNWGVGWSN